MKLKVEDLRVGNLIDWSGTVCTVTQIKNDGWVCVSYDNGNKRVLHLDMVKPIKLTENHLLNSGFEETSRNGYYRLADLLVSVEGQIYFGSEETWICECYFIHEIQNLAKSLFKFELEHNLCN